MATARVRKIAFVLDVECGGERETRRILYVNPGKIAGLLDDKMPLGEFLLGLAFGEVKRNLRGAR